jgi:hypothetical protein
LDCDMCNDFENSTTTKNEILPVTSSNINMDHRNKAEDEFRQEINIIWKKNTKSQKTSFAVIEQEVSQKFFYFVLFGSHLLFF